MKAYVGPLCLLVMLIVVTCSYSIAQQETKADIPAFQAFKPFVENPNDNELQKLLKARYNTSVEEVKTNYELLIGGKTTLDNLLDSGQRLVVSGLELSKTQAEKVALLTEYVELAKRLEASIQEKVSGGVEGISSLHRARYARLDAEIRLLRVKWEQD